MWGVRADCYSSAEVERSRERGELSRGRKASKSRRGVRLTAKKVVVTISQKKAVERMRGGDAIVENRYERISEEQRQITAATQPAPALKRRNLPRRLGRRKRRDRGGGADRPTASVSEKTGTLWWRKMGGRTRRLEASEGGKQCRQSKFNTKACKHLGEEF